MKYGSLFDPFTGKEKITLKEKKEFLQSPAYCDMIRKMVVGMTADYRMTVYLLSPDDTALAFTDGSRVMINTLNSLFADESIEKNNRVLFGADRSRIAASAVQLFSMY